MSKLQTVKITPHIVNVSTSDKSCLSRYFIRYQEYYESPEFAGKIFTLGEFRDWYSRTYGAFTYYTDWTGFNFPSHVLTPFKNGLFDPLFQEELELLELFRYRTDDFYIIGSNEPDVMDHEICHGLWYTNSEYRKQVEECIQLFKNKEEVQLFIKKLSETYGENTIIDELHAYHIEKSPSGYRDMPIYMPLRKALLPIRKKFFPGEENE